MEEKNESYMNTSIAFVDVVKFENDHAYRGGVLVTDIKTYPQEFRITSPIRPTALQKTLYGNTLEQYIFVELISVPLIRGIKSKPVLVIIKNPNLVNARTHISIPVVLIIEGGDSNIKVHNNHKEDLQIVKEVLSLINSKMLIEPFSRVQAAVLEAHKQKIGE